MTKAELLQHIQDEFDKFIKELLKEETMLTKLTSKKSNAKSTKKVSATSVANKKTVTKTGAAKTTTKTTKTKKK